VLWATLWFYARVRGGDVPGGGSWCARGVYVGVVVACGMLLVCVVRLDFLFGVFLWFLLSLCFFPSSVSLRLFATRNVQDHATYRNMLRHSAEPNSGTDCSQNPVPMQRFHTGVTLARGSGCPAFLIAVPEGMTRNEICLTLTRSSDLLDAHQIQ
jgi:hypothetical protein